LQGNNVSETTNGTTVIFPVLSFRNTTLQALRSKIPSSRRNAGDTVFRCDLTFVNFQLGQSASIFVPLKRMSLHARVINLSTEITGKIAEMGSLLYDWTSTI
jgi:hypothetical protein